jgi:hypothetical protein
LGRRLGGAEPVWALWRNYLIISNMLQPLVSRRNLVDELLCFIRLSVITALSVKKIAVLCDVLPCTLIDRC